MLEGGELGGAWKYQREAEASTQPSPLRHSTGRGRGEGTDWEEGGKGETMLDAHRFGILFHLTWMGLPLGHPDAMSKRKTI